MHFTDRREGGFVVSWAADSPGFEYRGKGTAGRSRGDVVEDAITQAEIEALLDRLDPWLHRHWQRIVLDENPVDLVALGAKVDAVMRAAGATFVDTEQDDEAGSA